MAKDPRFDTSTWETDDASTSKPERREKEEEEENSLGEDADANDDEDDEEGGHIVKPLSASELAAFEKREKKKGIIYISSIPHGMTVAKVRHLLSGFGDVDRIFLQDGREKESGEKRTGRQSKSAHFTEGWVEYKDKKVAKAVAEMLNAEPIGAASGGSGGGKGGKKAGGLGQRRWKDQIWTMKYLSGFKWGMLSEQLANERAARTSRVRAELSQSAHEQKDYLKKVERARVMRQKEERRKARETTKQQADSEPRKESGPKQRTFKQREAIVRDVREQREKRKKSSSAEDDDDDGLSHKRTKTSDSNSLALAGALAKIF